MHTVTDPLTAPEQHTAVPDVEELFTLYADDVLRVCSAASIAADEDLVTGAQGFFADLRHIFDDRIECAALFQCFLMVIEAFFYECSHFFSSP